MEMLERNGEHESIAVSNITDPNCSVAASSRPCLKSRRAAEKGIRQFKSGLCNQIPRIEGRIIRPAYFFGLQR